MLDHVFRPVSARYQAPSALSYSSTEIDGANSLVSLRELKTRCAVDYDETDHDAYLRGLLAQACTMITERTGTTMWRGQWSVEAEYHADGMREVRARLELPRYRVILPGPVDIGEELTLRDSDGNDIRTYSQGAALHRSRFDIPVEVILEDEDVCVSPYIYFNYTVSWDYVVPGGDNTSTVAEYIYRVASTLYAYRQSTALGIPAVRMVLESLGLSSWPVRV